ncbi:MAG: helix-turn-helix transcriptional regulator, partial [Candidatus Omnitrophota bacterium]
MIMHKQHIFFKLIAIVLINAFFCLDIAWSAGGDMKGLSTHLAPGINISGADFAKEVELIMNLRRAYREIRQVMRITKDINPGQVLDNYGITYSKAAVIDKRRLFIIINDNGNNRVFVVSESGKDPVIKELGPGDGYTVGEAIRILRQGAGLNQGVISEIERGKTYNPRIETLELIVNTLSAALEMDVMPLLQGRKVSKAPDSKVLEPVKQVRLDSETTAYKKKIEEMYGFTFEAMDLQEAQEELIIRLRAYFQDIEIYQDIETLTPKDTEEDSEEYSEEDIEEVSEDNLTVSTRLINLGKNYPELVLAKLAAVVAKEMIDKAIAKERDVQGTIEPPANIARLESIKILLRNVWDGSTEASEAQKQLQEQWGATVLTFLNTDAGRGFFDTLRRYYLVKRMDINRNSLPLTKKWARGFFAAYSALAVFALGVGLWNFFASGMGFDSGNFILAQLSAALAMNLPALLGMIISGVLAYGYYKAWRLPLADGEIGPSWTKEGRISYSQAINNLPALRQGMVKLSLNLYEMGNVRFPRDNDEHPAKGIGLSPFFFIAISMGLNQIGLQFFATSACLIGLGIYLGLGVWGSNFVKEPEQESMIAKPEKKPPHRVVDAEFLGLWKVWTMIIAGIAWFISFLQKTPNGPTERKNGTDDVSPALTLSDGSELSPGDSVEHSTFGQGTIISIVSGVRVIVDFGNAGTKTIAWEFALQYLSPSSGQQVEEKIDPKIAKNIEEMRRHIRENVIDSTIAENVIEI